MSNRSPDLSELSFRELIELHGVARDAADLAALAGADDAEELEARAQAIEEEFKARGITVREVTKEN